MHSLDICRQQYIDMICRYLQGRLNWTGFRLALPARWADEHDTLWRAAWDASRPVRRRERRQVAAGGRPHAAASDPRRLPRMLDRLCTLCILVNEEEPFRAQVGELLGAYRSPDAGTDEAQFIRYPPRVNVFERPLPSGNRHHYPCTAADIRAQLAHVPEYDLAGLWAVGLSPAGRDDRDSYGIYRRWGGGCGRPVIALFSVWGVAELRFDAPGDRGLLKRRYGVERRYGMQVDRQGDRLVGRWPAEGLRRFILEHVLLHEVGHHVQYEQRRRARQRRWLPRNVKEQFAEDYAIRFQRDRR